MVDTYYGAQPGCRESAAPCSSPPSPQTPALIQQEVPHLHRPLKTLTSTSCHIFWHCQTCCCDSMQQCFSFPPRGSQRIHSNMEESVSFCTAPALGQHLWNSFLTSTNEKKHSGRTRFWGGTGDQKRGWSFTRSEFNFLHQELIFMRKGIKYLNLHLWTSFMCSEFHICHISNTTSYHFWIFI